MSSQQHFKERYDAQQGKWRLLAKGHGHQYLNYLPPRGSVDFVLVGKMTSIGEKDAEEVPPGEFPAIDPPFNLYGSMGDLILNYGAHRHLCRPGETYYLTDLGKCAIPPSKAKGKREKEEFTTWYPLLLEELELVAKPTATVIPVGKATGNFLKNQPNFKYRLTEPILHWSTAVIAAAQMASSLFPQEWDQFHRATRSEDLIKSTGEVFRQAGLNKYMGTVERRIKKEFTDVRKHYMFTYKKLMPLMRPE